MAVGEWDQRELCPDGGCVGVIGPAGTCKTCGRAAQNWGDERKRGLIDPPEEAPADEIVAGADAAAEEEAFDEDEDDLDDDEADDEDEDEADGEDDLDDDDAVAPGASAAILPAPVEWGTRQLCSDGSCIGLIGGDGRCKVCGRAAGAPRTEGPAAEAAAGASGFTIVTTEAAVTTADDAVQTTASTITTDDPGEAGDASPDEPAAPDRRDPNSQEPRS